VALGSERHSVISENGGEIIVAIRSLGGSVVISQSPRVLLAVEPGSPFVIEGSALTSLSRDTFSYATALGHYFLHAVHTFPKPRDQAEGRLEVLYEGEDGDQDFIGSRMEAYWFAFGLLMPEGEFERVVVAEGTDGAARRFGVNPAMIELRMHMTK
jgi:Zn-dependent peptidase ImmA (M78 family)